MMGEDGVDTDVSTVISEWKTRFSSDWHDGIRSQALRGNLRRSRLRGICWQVFLEQLPKDMNQWGTVAKARRGRYEAMRDGYLANPTDLIGTSEDWSVNNPLSEAAENPWNQFFEDKELKKTIMMDVERTSDEVQFFQLARTHRLMLQILFVYAKENPQLGYRQGMHELVAPLLYTRAEHRLDASDPLLQGYPQLALALDARYVEHDTYAIFEKLMETAGQWFESNTASRAPSVASRSDFDSARLSSRAATPASAIVQLVTRVQDEHLSIADSELHGHMKALDITPQIYGMRWVRLLFGREMGMDDLFVLWDVMLADSPRLKLVEYVAVAMLIAVRDKLIGHDYTECMMTLMRYPGAGDITVVADRAFAVRKLCSSPHGDLGRTADAAVVQPSSGAGRKASHARHIPAQSRRQAESSAQAATLPSIVNVSPSDFKNLTAKVGGALSFFSESVSTIKDSVIAQSESKRHLIEEMADLKQQLERTEQRLRELDAQTCTFVNFMDECANLIDCNVEEADQQVKKLAVSEEERAVITNAIRVFRDIGAKLRNRDLNLENVRSNSGTRNHEPGTQTAEAQSPSDKEHTQALTPGETHIGDQARVSALDDEEGASTSYSIYARSAPSPVANESASIERFQTQPAVVENPKVPEAKPSSSISCIFDDAADEDEGLFAAPQFLTKGKRPFSTPAQEPTVPPKSSTTHNSSRNSRTVTPELLTVDNPDDPFQIGIVNNPGLARLLSDT